MAVQQIMAILNEESKTIAALRTQFANLNIQGQKNEVNGAAKEEKSVKSTKSKKSSKSSSVKGENELMDQSGKASLSLTPFYPQKKAQLSAQSSSPMSF